MKHIIKIKIESDRSEQAIADVLENLLDNNFSNYTMEVSSKNETIKKSK